MNRDLRLILHKTESSIMVAYVDHHDRAYAWAERRRIEAHPRTGAVQIVEVRERVEEAQPDLARLWRDAPLATAETSPVRPSVPAPVALFAGLDLDALLSVGVPEDWLAPVQAATEGGFFELAERLPAEAAEALLDFAATGVLRRPEAVVAAEASSVDPYQHPDALRRLLTVESTDELRAALDAPWERWSVFLHPSQRAVVERSYNGPARVAGSAGTGKTVVAVHRAVRLIRDDPSAHVLLTTFSEPLSRQPAPKALDPGGPRYIRRAEDLGGVVRRLGHRPVPACFGRKPRVASTMQVQAALADAARDNGLKGFSQRFLAAEWVGVIDAWRVSDARAYADVPRLGRRNRLGSRQREALWPVFEAAGTALKAQGVITSAGVFQTVADHYAGRAHKPFSHIVVDEAQDLGVPELRLLCAMAPEGQDRLFFAGDLGQRIFQQPFSWKALGADVRGRSTTLKVNYRTSQQIRETADRLLPGMMRDVDGQEEERLGTISVFEGPAPEIVWSESETAEVDRVASFIRDAAASGIAPAEIGVFVRSRRELPRARAAIEQAGRQAVELSGHAIDPGDRIVLATMHLAKGLEFKAVAVMACDDEVLPSAERIAAVIEEGDLDEVYETERHLLYVACTRARDRLMIGGVSPGSEFLADVR